MTEIRKCGTGWTYCDGQCWKCFKHSVTTTTTTGEIKAVIPTYTVSETIHYPQISGITPYVIKEGEQK